MEGLTRHVWGFGDGLPDQLILSIAQTSDGYLWLGTPIGLVKFDGFHFTEIGADTVPALHEFGVSCLLASNDGSLWIGSTGGGITRMNGTLIEHYGAEEGLQSVAIQALFQDQDGVIWAGSSRGLYRFEAGKFSRADAFGDRAATAITSDGSGGLWVAGVGITHYTHGQFIDISMPRQRVAGRIRSLSLGGDGTLWVGSFYGLAAISKDGSFHLIKDVHSSIRSLCWDEHGILWVGTVGDGLLYRSQDGRFRSAVTADTGGARVIRSIASTHNGDLWLGTQSGLVRLSHTGLDILPVSSASSSDLGSLFLDRDDSVWLAAGHLSRFRAGEERANGLPQIRDLQVRAVMRDSSGAMWVGTAGNGAYRFIHGALSSHLSKELGSNVITGFQEAGDGSIWIGTDVGLARWFNGSTDSFANASGAPHGGVRAMALAPDGAVWIGTAGGLYEFQNGRFVDSEAGKRLAHYRVWSLHTGGDGSIWIGTGSGVYLWSDGLLRHIILAGPSSRQEAVVSITEDAKDRLLIATTTTAYRFGRSELYQSIRLSPCKSFGEICSINPQLQPEIFAVAKETGAEIYGDLPAVARADSKGGVWYASYRGLVHVGADTISRREEPPPISIDSVLVDGVPIKRGDPIIVSPSAHNIQIRATPILLSSRTGLQLRRRLINLEGTWSDLEPGAESIYGKLPSGRYVFRVESNWPGDAASSFAEVVIQQETPFYLRAGFLVTGFAAFAFLVWLAYRLRIHQMELRFQAVADERNRVAREMHDTLLQSCIGVASVLEALEISQETEGHKIREERYSRWQTTLSYAREQVSESIREAREVIWNLRSADDHKPLDDAMVDVLKRLTSRTEIEARFLREGSALRLNSRAQHEVLMTTREAILNGISHAQAKRIVLRRMSTPSQLVICISDDGIGFKAAEVQIAESDHFGIAGMRERMRKLGGSVTIESELGIGTTIRLCVPLQDAVKSAKQ